VVQELWTNPKLGPLPSGHLVVSGTFHMSTRCGIDRTCETAQVDGFLDHPPTPAEGKGCERCLSLHDRDMQKA
jgi:hypothetical protein